MPRLFVAADLPSHSIAELVRLQPAPTRGIRLTSQSQMHLTLHFLGDADVDQAKSALQSVAVPEFLITLQGVGQFPSFGGGLILWVGVQRSDPLVQLHAAVGEALTGIGFRPEVRPYAPHITLARCKTRQCSTAVKAILESYERFELRDLPIRTFGLYSSSVVDEARVYRCEKRYALISRTPAPLT